MDTPTLRQILTEEMRLYADDGLNAVSYLTISEDKSLYTVIDIAEIRGKQFVATVLVARLLNNQIHIDVDKNDKPLADALKARGVPEGQLVLNYLHAHANAVPIETH